MYLPTSETEPIGMLEAALEATMKAEPIEVKIRTAQRAGTISGNSPAARAEAAHAAGVVSEEELAHLVRTAQLRDEVVRVDHFPQDMGTAEAAELLARTASALHPQREAA